jgi:hypothetical protein
MPLHVRLGCVAVATLASVLSGCGENRVSPASPSLMSSAEDTPRPAARFAPRRVDEDGDGYEDPEPAPGMPSTPGPVPPPDGVPVPGGIPVPVQLTINIVGSFGTLAFAPNPLQGTVGNTLIWTNNDFVAHTIVLDDGTPVGTIAPGQSSVAIPLVTPTASFHCTIHPSMTGQIVPVATLPTGEPAPGDPSQAPMPGPSAPDPYGDGDDGGYGDGYDYDYY